MNLVLVAEGEEEITPVVFLAAEPSPFELRRLQAAGAADVIALPFDPAELPKLINVIWSRISD